MNETEFTKKVKKRLKELNYNWFIKTQFLSHVGIPDIIGCCKGRFYAWELKLDDGRESRSMPMQKQILKWIRAAGGIGEFVYPSTLEVNLKNLEGVKDENKKQ